VVPILIFTIQILLGYKKPKFPRWLEKRQLKVLVLKKVIMKALLYFRKIKNFFKFKKTNNCYKMTNTDYSQRVIALISLFFSLSIAIPLPLTNLLPAIGILIMFLGLLERNKLLVCIGILIGCVGVAITYFIVVSSIKILIR
jgi:hypothetical protein